MNQGQSPTKRDFPQVSNRQYARFESDLTMLGLTAGQNKMFHLAVAGKLQEATDYLE